VLGSIFADLWGIFRPIIRLGLLVAFIWGVFVSDYAAEYRRLAFDKGRSLIASLLPEPIDPYETLRCQKVRTDMADLKRQEENLAKNARGRALVGIGATALSALAGKENTARFFAKDTIAGSVPAAQQLKVLRKTIRDSTIDNLECFKRGSGTGQELGGVTARPTQTERGYVKERVIEKTVIQERQPQTIIIEPEKKWERQPAFGGPEWDKRYPTPYSR
jgi:hypothetical protein